MNVLLLSVMAVLTLCDHASTVYFFKHTNLREGNGLLAKIISKYGLAGLFLAKAASFGLIVLINYVQPIWWPVLAALCAMYFGVVCWNLFKIHEQRK